MKTNQEFSDILTIKYCTTTKSKGTLFYFHSGGFMASSAFDLPKYQFDQLNKIYDVVLVRYPLAPEVSLDIILKETKEAVVQMFHDQNYENLCEKSIIFYGRSAGAYLAAYLCSKLIKEGIRVPDKLILLYGYAHFNDEAFYAPLAYYQNKTTLTLQQEKQILSMKKSNISRFQRTLLYMNARKLGTWFDYLSIHQDSLKEYNLMDNLSSFPTTFLGYSKYDPDVDPNHSKILEQFIPNTSVFISDSKDHVFDQSQNEETKVFLKRLISFLDKVE